MPFTVAVGSTISVEGFTFMMSPAAAGSVRKALIGQGAVPMSPDAWETLRILQGPCLFFTIACNIISTASMRKYLVCGTLTLHSVESLTLLNICRKTSSRERTH